MRQISFSKERAFTLVELLIVIAIIAILTVAFLPGALKAPARARDAGKIKTTQDIAAALEGYYNLHNNTYPATAAADNGCLTGAMVSSLGLSFPPSVNVTQVAADCSYHYWANAANTFYAVGFVPENLATATSAVGASANVATAYGKFDADTTATSTTAGAAAAIFTLNDATGAVMYLARGPQS